MNRLSRYLLLLLVGLSWPLWPNLAHATTANVSCTATVSPVNFGAVSPSTTATVTATGSVQFTCRNSSLAFTQDVTLCVGLAQGSGSSIAPTRQMAGPAGGPPLAFQVYKTSGVTQVWGNVPFTANPTPLGLLQFRIPNTIFGGSYTSPNYPVYGNLVTPQAGVLVGGYINNLNGSLSYQANDEPILTNYPATCDGGNINAFSLAVQASVASQCTVTAGPTLNLGSVASTATDIAGNNTINVTCTNGTPYYVGLAPSNGNPAGAGVMSGSIGGNTDKVPYQLRSTTGVAGTIWGNTATATSVGNGVQGSGNGSSQPIIVYATVPSANVRPDTYTDTVTVNVNY